MQHVSTTAWLQVARSKSKHKHSMVTKSVLLSEIIILTRNTLSFDCESNWIQVYLLTRTLSLYKTKTNTIESQMPRTESSQGPYRNKMKRFALKSHIVLSKIRFQKQNAGEHSRITEAVIKWLFTSNNAELAKEPLAVPKAVLIHQNKLRSSQRKYVFANMFFFRSRTPPFLQLQIIVCFP